MKHIFFLIACLFSGIFAFGAQPGAIRFHNENADTTRINRILEQYIGQTDVTADVLAREFINCPYKAATLEGEPEQLTVNMEEFDCTTFCETILALQLTIREKRVSWRDFVHNLQQLRYRGGEVNGYPSRLHYMSDWIIDNNHRGIINDATRLVGIENYVVKTLDYMSRHATSYPALADSANLAGIKNCEIGYRSHRYPYIKKNNLSKARFRNGDMVLLLTKIPGLDATHVGFITLNNGVPYLLHASSKSGKVTIEQKPLYDYLQRNTSAIGVRVVRLAD